MKLPKSIKRQIIQFRQVNVILGETGEKVSALLPSVSNPRFRVKKKEKSEVLDNAQLIKALNTSIQSKEDLYRAIQIWDTDEMLRWESDEWVSICKVLVSKAKQFKVPTMYYQLWINTLTKPDRMTGIRDRNLDAKGVWQTPILNKGLE